MDLTFKSPLEWPKGWPQTPKNMRGFENGFKAQMTLKEAASFLSEEVAQCSLANAVLTCDVADMMNDRQRKRLSEESGACLRFRYEGTLYTLACDRWYLLEHNLYALHLALRNLNNVVRWGVASFPRAFKGFEAMIMASDGEKQDLPLTDWQRELGLGPTATLEDAQATYRRRAKLAGTNEEALMKLNLAMERAKQALAG